MGETAAAYSGMRTIAGYSVHQWRSFVCTNLVNVRDDASAMCIRNRVLRVLYAPRHSLVRCTYRGRGSAGEDALNVAAGMVWFGFFRT